MKRSRVVIHNHLAVADGLHDLPQARAELAKLRTEQARIQGQIRTLENTVSQLEKEAR
jgi:hypothetical protein